MKRYIRTRFLVGLAVLGALLASGYVILRLKIDPEAVRNRTIAELSELLGAEVTVARATFDPVLGFRLDDLTVSTRDDQGRKKVLARAPRVKLMHCPMSLLNGRIRYRYISIREPQIYIERTRLGRCNIEHLLDALREHHLAGASIPTINVRQLTRRQ